MKLEIPHRLTLLGLSVGAAFQLSPGVVPQIRNIGVDLMNDCQGQGMQGEVRKFVPHDVLPVRVFDTIISQPPGALVGVTADNINWEIRGNDVVSQIQVKTGPVVDGQLQSRHLEAIPDSFNGVHLTLVCRTSSVVGDSKVKTTHNVYRIK